MKAKIPNNYKSCLGFNNADLARSKEILVKTWEEFRNAIAEQQFDYTNTDAALSTTFLKQFDVWFQEIGESELSTNLTEYFHKKASGRGSIIQSTEPPETPTYDRLLPKAEYIKNDNRFSPPGVEWLYLSIGKSLDQIKECAEKECRAKINNRFAFCKFMINPNFSNLKIVNLTIADTMSYDSINKSLISFEINEYKKLLKKVSTNPNTRYLPKLDEPKVKHAIAKWTLYTYIKMISENLFVPIQSNDKKLEYSPFQTLAMYFIKKGYDGIVYSSTVCPNAKNIVLFDKNYAIPYDEVIDYIISS